MLNQSAGKLEDSEREDEQRQRLLSLHSRAAAEAESTRRHMSTNQSKYSRTPASFATQNSFIQRIY